MMRPGTILLCALAAMLPGLLFAADAGSLRQRLLFHASYDGGVDADFAKGDPRLFTASTYKSRDDVRPGLHNPDVRVLPGKGRYGDALEFRKKNTMAVHYLAAGNVNYGNGRWNGTVSFWISLDPDKDLEPGFSDPIQITERRFDDAALWVDFSRDETPRLFRLGVFGDARSWNPKGLDALKHPLFPARLVSVKNAPFSRERWTHVVVTHTGLGTGAGAASLYLDGHLQGTTGTITESFNWDFSGATIRIGMSYVGLFDDLAVFDEPLPAEEVRALYRLDKGVGSLYK